LLGKPDFPFSPGSSRSSLVLAIATVSLLFHTGCERLKSRAVGPNGEVTIVTDLPAGSASVEAVGEVIGRQVVTVRSEPAFSVDRIPGSQFQSARFWRNLIFLADLSRPGATTDLVTRTVGEELVVDFRAGRRLHAFYPDVWARGQTILVLAGTGDRNLADAIRGRGDEIYRAFERRVTRQTLALLYLAGELEDFTRYTAETYGWSIRIPKGYRIGEDAEERFVRFFMRQGGGRLLFVHWQDGLTSLPSPESCLATRGRLVAKYYDGDFVDSTRTHDERVDFLGRRALKLVGVWQNEKHTIGGPFRTYCLFDTGRFVMIDLAVFDPAGSKQELLRQLEAIALTFRDRRP
jgi:hypothetical protein